jgi:hypothetical protein
MAGQTIERQIAGYPITLLEVHTLVHVVCAVIMYGLWIQKPLNVKDPTIVDFGDATDILAFMVERARESLEPDFFNFKNLRQPNSPEPKLLWYKDLAIAPIVPQEITVPGARDRLLSSLSLGSLDSSAGSPQGPSHFSVFFASTQEVDRVFNYNYDIGKIKNEYVPASNNEIVCIMASGESSPLGYGPTYYKRSCRRSEDQQSRETCTIDLISFSEKDILRLDSTAKFLARGKTQTGRDMATAEEIVATTFTALFSAYSAAARVKMGYYRLLTSRVANFNGKMLSFGSGRAYNYAALALIPAAYGAIHVGALELCFPSLMERLLWNTSCYILILSAIACGVIGLSVYLNHQVEKKWDLNIGQMLEHSPKVDSPWGIIIFVFIFLNTGARLYIVVESFISLRHVPVGVYQTPVVNFMNYIPHL